MYSDAKKLVPTARHRLEFFHPEKQLDQTAGYNEMVYKRYQNGERKQPDYIVVFKQREEVSNMEKAVLAAKQWKEFGKEMPIVVVDKDRCREEGLENLNEMLEHCQSQQEVTAIKNKIHRLSNWSYIPEKCTEKFRTLEQEIGAQEQLKESKEELTDIKEPEIQESKEELTDTKEPKIQENKEEIIDTKESSTQEQETEEKSTQEIEHVTVEGLETPKKEEPIGIETFRASLGRVNAHDRNVEMQRISNMAKQIVQESENYRGTQSSQDIGDEEDGR